MATSAYILPLLDQFYRTVAKLKQPAFLLNQESRVLQRCNVAPVAIESPIKINQSITLSADTLS